MTSTAKRNLRSELARNESFFTQREEIAKRKKQLQKNNFNENDFDQNENDNINQN